MARDAGISLQPASETFGFGSCVCSHNTIRVLLPNYHDPSYYDFRLHRVNLLSRFP